MTPPDAPLAGPAEVAQISVLKKRADFLTAAKARRVPVAGFLLQARARAATEEADGIRVGFTCSKKVGNSVVRNRAKRRLRALAREVMPSLGRAGWDYVLVGKPDETVTRPYADLLDDLRRALGRVHG